MAEDEELVLKGSAIYEYLHDNGITNFDAYDVGTWSDHSDTTLFQQNLESLPVMNPAPQWCVDHFNCILNYGLVLEDHRRFLESYRPLVVQKSPSYMYTLILSGTPFLWLCGTFSRLAQSRVSQTLFWTALSANSLFAVFHLKRCLNIWSMSQALKRLPLTLKSMEKVFVQFKKMLLLVHQNELVAQNIALHKREMSELKKKLRSLLLSSIHKYLEFLNVVKNVPLSIDVDPTLQSLSATDADCGAYESEDISWSLVKLKELFNRYILVQSEYLRRLALCYCPELWCKPSLAALYSYSQQQLPLVYSWSVDVHQTLIQEHKFFKSVMESKDQQNPRKLPSGSNWDFFDIYVSIRSANIHFQSLLLQTQGLQDFLENEGCNNTKEKREFLCTIAEILTEVNKDISSGQVCVDASLVKTFKMISAHFSTTEQCDLKSTPSITESSEVCLDSVVSMPVEDEVFELTVSQEDEIISDEDEWNDITVEHSAKNKKEKETSRKVLQELKTVLVKKAEEWKEREKRALESKGIPYTPPEQVKLLLEDESTEEGMYLSKPDEGMDFLPTNNQNVWPLPRLKRNVVTHRSYRRVNQEVLTSVPSKQDSEEEYGSTKTREAPRIGFGALLLAEAIAKSTTMSKARKEDVFLDSSDETSSGE